MTLSPGEKLGPYQILSQIGKGGFGMVYRATDTRLGRSVAIKVSVKEFNDRFEREARAISALNHPNICTLYDVGPNYLVMEFIEGETLSEIIHRGPVPLDKALEYATQIADALAAAHAKKITHRDLKPGNIMVTRNGVKVLDFGLAKLQSEAHSKDPLATSAPTVTEPISKAGALLGTIQYMSPEQIEGKEADARSDIFAFGALLHEMITGKRAFTGDTTAGIMASILKEQPAQLSHAQPAVPRSLERTVRKCLEKKPEDRWQTAQDLKTTLEMIDLNTPPVSASSGNLPVPLQTPLDKSRAWLWSSVATVLALGVAGLGWNAWRAPALSDLPLVRQDVNLGSDIVLPIPVTFASNVIISPDGTRLAYVARPSSGGALRLFTRRLDQAKAMELPGTANAGRPFFSRDGRWLGFAIDRRLYKISVDGGAAAPLTDLTGTFAGAAWGDAEIFVAQQGLALARISEGGGPLSPVIDLEKGEAIQSTPVILPSGKAVLFSSNFSTDPDKATIDVFTLADRHRKTLARGATFPRFAAPPNGAKGAGHLRYIFKGALYAIPFDAETLETHGTAVPVLDDVSGAGAVPGKFDVSQTGTLVYQRGGGNTVGDATIQWLDSTGKPQPLLAKQGRYRSPRLSPDGKRVALSVADGADFNIQVYEWQSDRTTKLTSGGRAFNIPVWSPDGQFVLFYSGTGQIFWTRADGSGQPQEFSLGNRDTRPWSLSPDGKRLAYLEGGNGIRQILTMELEERGGQLKTSKSEPFLKDNFNDTDPSFAPDGKWLAYTSSEVGSVLEVYVRPFPLPASGQGGKWVISNQGGSHPVWSRAGNDLLYQAPGGQIMAVGYTVKGEVFVADKPRVWLEKPGSTDWDLSPDGKRIAVVTPVGTAQGPAPAHEVAFLLNFFDELRRRVPPGK